MSQHPSVIAAFNRLEVPDDRRRLIIERHSEAHRRYHTLRHIDLMLRQVPADHACTPEMMVATLFHDIVYEPTRSDNEELSLAMFQSVADGLTPSMPLDRQLVSDMILATRSHHFREGDAAKDDAINLLLKADLSILWHPDPEVYAWYAAGVRQEYAFVPEDAFRAARAKILLQLRDDLLGSEQLTEAEAKVLAFNVAWELRQD
ncbi:HD domain-containing protein [Novosphingobium rosa]|uniref:HD domain-containing protein n=1 Tax=Novosphingobium rosa TaxID=76978 RepID=UPI000AE5EF13|nr:metal-dependent phosphohydrolase [Novosphingobium rosa]